MLNNKFSQCGVPKYKNLNLRSVGEEIDTLGQTGRLLLLVELY